ncbi:MAG TPA: hypothetical protein V6C69_19850 [Trichormus sp.]|jgi:hypothetical protein
MQANLTISAFAPKFTLFGRIGRALRTLLVLLLLCSFMLFEGSSCRAGIIREITTPTMVTDEYNAIEELVKRYYPRAKFTRTTNGLRFAYKLKPELGYYSDRIVLAPLDGGILGELILTPGKCSEIESTVPDGFHSTLTLGPYSQNLQSHLLVKLTYPASDFSPEFEDKFIDLVNRFGVMDDAVAPASSPSEAVPQNASKHSTETSTPAS